MHYGDVGFCRFHPYVASISVKPLTEEGKERNAPSKAGAFYCPQSPLTGTERPETPPHPVKHGENRDVCNGRLHAKLVSQHDKTGHLETYQTARQKQSRACLHKKVSTARNECELRGGENSLLMITGRKGPAGVSAGRKQTTAAIRQSCSCSGSPENQQPVPAVVERPLPQQKPRRFYPWLVCGAPLCCGWVGIANAG